MDNQVADFSQCERSDGTNTAVKLSLSNTQSSFNDLFSSSNAPLADSWGETDVKFEKISHLWTINHYRFFHDERGEPLVSSVFTAGSASKYKWLLVLYPKNKHDDKYISLHLGLRQVGDYDDLFVKFKFSILNVDHVQVHTLHSNLRKFTKTSKSMGYPKYLDREYLFSRSDQLLPDDKFTIFCEVTFAKMTDVHTTSNAGAVQTKVSECILSEDFSRLMNSYVHSDVVISVNGRGFPAHKAILSARSPVFAAMFSHDMKEELQNRVDITNMEEEVFEALLSFIYTAKVPNLKKMAYNLLPAAEMYDIKDLKLLCEETLRSNLCISNAVDVLVLADLHQAERLKEQVAHYIRTYASSIMKAESWKAVVSKHPHLISDIYFVPKEPPAKKQRTV